jgi:tRNA A37 methylthiotransferase MiaB
VSISFGVESGNQKILDLMRKGTNVKDIKKVLCESHQAGIKNIVFIMFGFPGEDKESFMDTINFLKENSDCLDIVSAAVFGLQEGSYVYEHPDEFEVYDVCKKGTPLGKSIGYKVKNGLDEKNAKAMKEMLIKEIRKINKMPRIVCLLKEQSLFF